VFEARFSSASRHIIPETRPATQQYYIWAAEIGKRQQQKNNSQTKQTGNRQESK